MAFLPENDIRREVWAACESPIEQWLCRGLFILLGCRAVAGAYDQTRRAELAKIAGSEPAAFLFAQHRIGRYRADFLVVLVDPTKRISRHFIIECDGKNFHSSDEQRSRDAERDAAILAGGYRVVLRIAGRDLRLRFAQTFSPISLHRFTHRHTRASAIVN